MNCVDFLNLHRIEILFFIALLRDFHCGKLDLKLGNFYSEIIPSDLRRDIVKVGKNLFCRFVFSYNSRLFTVSDFFGKIMQIKLWLTRCHKKKLFPKSFQLYQKLKQILTPFCLKYSDWLLNCKTGNVLFFLILLTFSRKSVERNVIRIFLNADNIKGNT